jgi:cobalt-zinc-cadmium efflux system membrane fusion protein
LYVTSKSKDANATVLCLIGSLLFTFVLLVAQPATFAAHYDSAETVGPTGQVLPLSTLGKSSVGLQIEPVVKKLLPLELTTPGKIEPIPSHEYAQHSAVAGRVSEVLVNLGDGVTKGQILLELESTELNRLAAQILQNKQDIEAQVAQQQAVLDDEVNECRARIRYAEETNDRNVRLFNERIGSQKDLQSSAANLDVAKAQMKAAQTKRDIVLNALETKLKLILQPLRQQLEILGASEDDIANMLKLNQTVTMAPVRSARTGVITAINASAGQSVDPTIKLFTVSDLTRVWATAQIYEDDMGRVKVGQKVKVRLPAFQNKVFAGTLSYIGDHVDVRSRTLPVRAEIANLDLKLKPDMYAELVIQIDDPALSVMLPSDAVIERNGHSIVFVEVTNGYQPTRVTVGRSFGDMVEISAGLEPGQRAVVHGAFQLAAEMLKSTGNSDQFQQSTEGDHENTEISKEKGGSGSVSTYALAVAIAIAFVLGGLIATIVVKLRKAAPATSSYARRAGDNPEIDEHLSGGTSATDTASSTRREKL